MRKHYLGSEEKEKGENGCFSAMDMEKNVTSSVVVGKNELFGSGGCEA
jgi:hypothetical protein